MHGSPGLKRESDWSIATKERSGCGATGIRPDLSREGHEKEKKNDQNVWSFTCAHTYALKTKADRISEWKHQDVSALLCTAGTH